MANTYYPSVPPFLPYFSSSRQIFANAMRCDRLVSIIQYLSAGVGRWFQTKTTLLLSGDAYDNLIKKSASEENRNYEGIFSQTIPLERTIFIIKICIQFCAAFLSNLLLARIVYNPIPMLSQLSSRVPLASTLLPRLSLFILYRRI